MATNELAVFTDSVNTLIEGQLILVDKHIAQVLKCVATSPMLCHALSETTKNMSYATEFSRARVTWTRLDGTVDSSLKLPADRNRLFAFVVCLLTEVDCGRRNLMDFLREYYYAGDNDHCFAKFAEEVLKPFKQAGEWILSQIDPDSVNYQYVEQAEHFFKAEKIYIDTPSLNAILSEMEQIRQITLRLHPAPSPADTSEYNMSSEFLVNSLYLKNPKIITVSFLAYKYVAAKYGGSLEHLQKIAEVLNKIMPV